MKSGGKSARALGLAGVLLLSSSGAWAAEEQATESRNAPPFVLSVKDVTLSARIENVPLGQVLKELARQASLEVYIATASTEEKISAEFDKLTLEEGIKRLLKGKNYILTYDRTAASPRVTEIKVIADGSAPVSRISGQPASIPPPGTSAGEKTVEELARQALQAPDPAARIAALKALSQRGDEEKIRSTVSAALQDQDLGVRSTALDLAARGAPVSDEAIQGMALRDADPGLRIKALDELSDRSDPDTAIEYLKQATRDPDPKVASTAQRLIRKEEEEKITANEEEQ
jgi:hypothetical protein